MVANEGVDSLSLRAVAQKLGVSYAAPAHHFANREALVEALRDEAWVRFASALEPAEGKGLREVGRAYIDFALEHPRQVELMFRPNGDQTEASVRAWEVLLRSVAKELGPTGVKNPNDLFAAAMSAWAAVQGFATVAKAPFVDDLKTRGELRERLLDMVVAGLRTRSG